MKFTLARQTCMAHTDFNFEQTNIPQWRVEQHVDKIVQTPRTPWCSPFLTISRERRHAQVRVLAHSRWSGSHLFLPFLVSTRKGRYLSRYLTPLQQELTRKS